MRYSNLSNIQIEQIIEKFVLGHSASEAAINLQRNRKTINRFYSLFRDLIFDHQKRIFEITTGQKMNNVQTNIFGLIFHKVSRQFQRSRYVFLCESYNERNSHLYGTVFIFDSKIAPNKSGEARLYLKLVKESSNKQNGVQNKLRHLKECEWRYGKSSPELKIDLKQLMCEAGHF